MHITRASWGKTSRNICVYTVMGSSRKVPRSNLVYSYCKSRGVPDCYMLQAVLLLRAETLIVVCVCVCVWEESLCAGLSFRKAGFECSAVTRLMLEMHGSGKVGAFSKCAFFIFLCSFITVQSLKRWHKMNVLRLEYPIHLVVVKSTDKSAF